MERQATARQIVRRLYLYAISGIALGIIMLSAAQLLGLVLDLLFRAVSGHDWVQEGGDWERGRLSLYLPLLAIAGPIWYAHWRMLRRDRLGPHADDERRSRVRAVYLTAVLASTTLAGVTSLLWTLTTIVERWFGRTLEPFERNDLVQNLAVLATLATIWVFHWRVRERDVREGPLDGIAAWLPRAYRYATTMLGAIFLAFGASSILIVAGKAVVGSGETGTWWREPLASGVANVIIGGLFWGYLWVYAARLLRGETLAAHSERESLLRRVYLIGILGFTSVASLIFISNGIERAIWEVLDDRHVAGRAEQVREIGGPFLAVVPFVLLGLFHHMRLLDEARRYQSAAQAAETRRVAGYALGFVGLAFTSLGTAALLWTLYLWIGGVATEAPLGMGGWQGQVALGAAGAVSGAALWLWHWYRALQRMSLEPNQEQISTARRTYLFAAVGGALVGLIIGLAFVIYQLMQRALGVTDTGNLAEDISGPLGLVTVMAAVAAYHGLLLLRDLRVQAEETAPPVVAPPARLAVVITGPAGADLPAFIAGLRGQLPAGYDIRPLDGTGVPATSTIPQERRQDAAPARTGNAVPGR